LDPRPIVEANDIKPAVVVENVDQIEIKNAELLHQKEIEKVAEIDRIIEKKKEKIYVGHDWAKTELYRHCKTFKRFTKPILNDPSENNLISILSSMRSNQNGH
jgi:hypothetical protein